MIASVPKMVCYYCVINAGLDPSYALLPSQAPPAERRFAVPIAEYEHHCFVSHTRMATPAAEERLAWQAREEYGRHLRRALASARPHGRCETAPRCVEHAADRRVPSCKSRRDKGRRT